MSSDELARLPTCPMVNEPNGSSIDLCGPSPNFNGFLFCFLFFWGGGQNYWYFQTQSVTGFIRIQLQANSTAFYTCVNKSLDKMDFLSTFFYIFIRFLESSFSLISEHVPCKESIVIMKKSNYEILIYVIFTVVCVCTSPFIYRNIHWFKFV